MQDSRTVGANDLDMIHVVNVGYWWNDKAVMFVEDASGHLGGLSSGSWDYESMKLQGRLDYCFHTGFAVPPYSYQCVSVWRLLDYISYPIGSKYYALSHLPYDRMWLDERIWLPILLTGRQFDGILRFSPENGQLLFINIEIDSDEESTERKTNE